MPILPLITLHDVRLTALRSACRAFVGDVQSSIAYLRASCFYSADINFELAAAQDLWEACNPGEWKTIFMSKPSSRARTEEGCLSLLEIVNEPLLLATASTYYDLKLSAHVAVHCMWIQVASYLDSRALFHDDHPPSRSGSSLLWIEAQRQDLYQKIKQAQCVIYQLALGSAETWMLCEFLLMSLYAPPMEIQRAAGRFGDTDSHSAATKLQYCSQSEGYRYSIWHAGQVLRAAQTMHPNFMHGFYAIAVFQACLTLLMASVRPKATVPTYMDPRGQDKNTVQPTHFPTGPQSRSSLTTSTPAIILNGVKNADTDGYLIMGLGSPALRLNGQAHLLSKADTIPNSMESIFQGSHTTTNLFPPLLHELLAMVKELSTTL